jgi:hypothetical protein
MSGSQRLLLVVLVLAVTGGATAVWLSDGRPAGLDTARPEVGPAVSPGSQLLETRGGAGERVGGLDLEHPGTHRPSGTASTVEHPLEVRLVLVKEGSFDGGELPPPRSDANAHLKGLLRGSKGTGVPGTVTFVAGPNQGRELRTDSTGRFGATDLYQGLSLVRVKTDGGLTSEREFTLRQLSESELNLDMSRRAAAYVSGTVTDLSGAPLEGAEVRMDGGTTLTDIKGEFEFPRITPGKVPATVKKHGYAHSYQLFHVVHGRAISRDKLTFVLHPGVDLELRLEAAVGSPGPVQVFIVPVGGRSVGTQLGARTFPWHEINPIQVHPGGSTLIEGMQEGHVSILAFHPGAVASPPLVNKNLVPGRENQHLIRLRAAPTVIRGLVKGVDGKPVRGARVRLEDPARTYATSQAMQQRRPDYMMGAVVPHMPAAMQETTTDRTGRFVLTAYPKISPKGYYLTVESADGKARAVRTVTAARVDLEIELEEIEESAGQLVVRMGGRYQGLPIDATINGQPLERFTLPAEEHLRLDGLVPGLWLLEIWWNRDQLVPGKQLRIEPERETTELLVLPLPAIEGRAG